MAPGAISGNGFSVESFTQASASPMTNTSWLPGTERSELTITLSKRSSGVCSVFSSGEEVLPAAHMMFGHSIKRSAIHIPSELTLVTRELSITSTQRCYKSCFAFSPRSLEMRAKSAFYLQSNKTWQGR